MILEDMILSLVNKYFVSLHIIIIFKIHLKQTKYQLTKG